MSTRDFTIAAKHDLNIFSFVKIAAIFFCINIHNEIHI